ncbi:MAG: TIGR03545 family protein [Nitrospinae bacterium]|nr:TIGR03545 family protein [Nitrospinota bacterium]MBL7021311.1 TIGR03545 family protein [Nitrospinaceae bacterium]
MKLFRWQGVLAFALVGGVVGVFLFLFLDGMIERGIEEKGSEVAKTQIDIGSLTTSLLSQSVALSRIEIANPDNNMENLIQFEKLSLDLNGAQIVSHKIIIDELQAHGIKLNQKRTQPAQVIRSAESTQEAGQESAASQSSLPGLGELSGLSVKSPEEILKSEKLETLEAGNRAKKTIDDLKAKWEKKFETDLNPNALKETQQKLTELQKKVTGGDLTEIPKALQEFENLQKDIQDRMNRITSMKSEFEKDMQMAKQQVADLKNLPQKDFERLKNKYSLSPGGGKNILGSMLEGPLKEKLDKAWKTYKMISPYLNQGKKSSREQQEYVRGKGIDISFAKASPYPDFLLKHGDLSLILFDTEVKGEVKDLSDNQTVYGKPAKLNFQSGKNQNFNSFALAVTMDKTGPQSLDSIALDMQGLNLKNVGQAELKDGSAKINGLLTIIDENNLNGIFKAELDGVALSIPQQEGNELANTIAQSLSSIDRINISVEISGTIENYQLDIKSNLTEIVSKAVKKALAGKMKGFESSLMSAIQAKTGDVLSGTSGSLSGLLGQNKILNDSGSAYGGLLGQAKGGATELAKPKGGLSLPGGLKLPF